VKRFSHGNLGLIMILLDEGSAQDLWDEQLDVRDLLRAQSATEWVIVSTGLFMSFLFEPSFGVIEFVEGEWVVRALGGWENKVTVTTPEDIGRLTAGIVFEEPGAKNEVLFTAGETVSYGDLAGIVEGVVGKKVKRELWTVKRLERELEEQRGKEGETMAKYRVAFAVGKGVSWEKERSWNWKRGVDVTGVKEYAMKTLKE
jgi:hypothetical protein